MGKQQRLKGPQIKALAGAGLVLAAIITIGALTEDGEPATSAGDPSTTATSSPAGSAPTRRDSPEPSPATSETQTEDDAVLTAQTNDELAALLVSADPAARAMEFATKYAGRTIRYDGVIAAINNHKSYDTRFDILVPVGDDPGKATAGPNFHFRDVNLTVDLKLTGDNVPDTLRVGDKVGVTAEVVEYDERQDLLRLDPVETTLR